MVGPSTHFFFQGLRIELQLETRYYCAQEGGGGKEGDGNLQGAGAGVG